MKDIKEHNKPAQYKDKIARQFIRRAIHGGRCVPYMRVYENTLDPLMAADANSLYTAAMMRLKKFPDVTKSRKLIDEELMLEPHETIEGLESIGHGYILEVDVSIPQTL